MSNAGKFVRRIGEAEAKQIRRARVIGLTFLIGIPLLAGVFLWQDISEGNYAAPLFFGSLGLIGAWRSQRNFRRGKARD